MPVDLGGLLGGAVAGYGLYDQYKNLADAGQDYQAAVQPIIQQAGENLQFRPYTVTSSLGGTSINQGPMLSQQAPMMQQSYQPSMAASGNVMSARDFMPQQGLQGIAAGGFNNSSAAPSVDALAGRISGAFNNTTPSTGGGLGIGLDAILGRLGSGGASSSGGGLPEFRVEGYEDYLNWDGRLTYPDEPLGDLRRGFKQGPAGTVMDGGIVLTGYDPETDQFTGTMSGFGGPTPYSTASTPELKAQWDKYQSNKSQADMLQQADARMRQQAPQMPSNLSGLLGGVQSAQDFMPSARPDMKQLANAPMAASMPSAQGGNNLAYNLSPQMQAIQDQTFGGAQQLFGQALAPTGQRVQDLYGQMRALQTPEEQRARLLNEERMAAQGRLGLQSAAYGGTSPELLAQEQAIAQARNQASLMAQQQAQAEQAQAYNIGSGMLSSGFTPTAQLMNQQTQANQLAQLYQNPQLQYAQTIANLGLGGVEAAQAAEANRQNLLGQMYSLGAGMLTGRENSVTGKLEDSILGGVANSAGNWLSEALGLGTLFGGGGSSSGGTGGISNVSNIVNQINPSADPYGVGQFGLPAGSDPFDMYN